MSTKPAQASELREALNRSQTAKANKANAERRLKRAESNVDTARKEADEATTEVRETDAALAAVLRKDLSKVMKDGELLMAIAGLVADASAGAPAPAGPAASAPATSADHSAKDDKSAEGNADRTAPEEQDSLSNAA